MALTETRAGGRPLADAGCSRCEERERELVRLRNLVHTREATDGARYFGQGYQAAVRYYGSLDARLDTALDLLRELLGRRRRRGPGRARPPAARALGQVEVVATPVLGEQVEQETPA